MTDIIIIGAGPAGLTAAIYALRAGKEVIVFEKENIGGKITSSPMVANYPGFIDVPGMEIADNLYNQFEKLGGQIELEEVLKIENGKNKKVITEYGEYETKAIIIASGTNYRMLGLENEENLVGNGVSFCVTCDAPFYKDKIVAVIGGANSAVVEALELAKIASKVYLIYRKDKLRADYQDVKKLEELENVEIIYNANVTKYLGANELEGVILNDNREIKVDGVFLAIGQDANMGMIENIDTDDKGFALAGNDCKTNIQGIFVAGDVRSKKVRQLTTAVSDGTIAALEAIEYLDRI